MYIIHDVVCTVYRVQCTGCSVYSISGIFFTGCSVYNVHVNCVQREVFEVQCLVVCVECELYRVLYKFSCVQGVVCTQCSVCM